MKQITLIMMLLIAAFGFSQELPIDFDNPNDANFVGVGGNTFQVILDGTDNVGETVGGTDEFNSRVDLALETFIDMTTANKTFTFEFYTSEAVVMTGLFQINNEENGGFPIEMQFTTDGNIGWETITLDFNNATNGFPNQSDPVVFGQYAGLSVFTNFGDTGSSTYWFDDIAGAANGATVPPPTSDPEPATAAPTPDELPSQVISLFSNAYTNISVDAWSATWDDSDVEDVVVAGDDVKKITFTNFLGVDFATQPFDASNMTHFHMDYWTDETDLVGKVLNPKWSNHQGGNGETNAFDLTNTIPMNATGQWQSVEVPLTDFVPVNGNDKSAFAQFLLTSNLSIVYVDNIYLFNPNLSTDDFAANQFSAFPNPTTGNWNIKSSNTNIQNIEIFNTLGRLVKEVEVGNTETVIDASGLSSGIYFAKIYNDNNQNNTIKLIKR